MKPYNDFASRNGSKTDYLSIGCMIAGMIALITLMLYLGVIADALIGLIELI